MAEVSDSYNEALQMLQASAERGNEKARSALNEDDGWRNMSFVVWARVFMI